MSIVAWLLALVGPLVVRGLLALGFTAITYTGVSVAVNALIATAQSTWSAMPAAIIQLAGLSGIPQGLGVVMGTYMALYALRSAAGFKRYVVKS